MSAADDLILLLQELRNNQQRTSMFEEVLAEIAGYLSELVQKEPPSEDRGGPGDQRALISALSESLRGLTLKPPDVHVTVPPAPAPIVTVMPASETAQLSWDLTIVSRDEMGRPHRVRLTPEK